MTTIDTMVPDREVRAEMLSPAELDTALGEFHLAYLPLGSLDLTTAHPSGVSKLLAGRPTTIADLVREPAALTGARRRARALSDACATVLEQRGLPIGFLALGMATWAVPSMPGPRSPQAPVMLRSVVLRPTGPAAVDFEIDLGVEVELNPVLVHYLRLEAQVPVDEVALASLADGGHGFDPYPVYAELSRLCADVPEFSVSPRLVISTFPHSKLDMVADLAAQQDRLPGHDVVAALAGDAEARDLGLDVQGLAAHRQHPAPDAQQRPHLVQRPRP